MRGGGLSRRVAPATATTMVFAMRFLRPAARSPSGRAPAPTTPRRRSPVPRPGRPGVRGRHSRRSDSPRSRRLPHRADADPPPRDVERGDGVVILGPDTSARRPLVAEECARVDLFREPGRRQIPMTAYHRSPIQTRTPGAVIPAGPRPTLRAPSSAARASPHRTKLPAEREPSTASRNVGSAAYTPSAVGLPLGDEVVAVARGCPSGTLSSTPTRSMSSTRLTMSAAFDGSGTDSRSGPTPGFTRIRLPPSESRSASSCC